MTSSDVLVGSVAIGVGIFILSTSVFNWDWYYELRKAKWIESVCGRQRARVLFALLGLFLVTLGTLMAGGLLPKFHWQAQPSAADGLKSKT